MISGSLGFAHFLLMVGNELFNLYIFVGRFYVTVAHWATLRLFHPIINAFLAESMHAGNQSGRHCHLLKANRALELLGNLWICHKRLLVFATKIQVFHEFLKISDPLIYLNKIIALLLLLRSYEFFIIFLLLSFYFVGLPDLLQYLLCLFGVSSDCVMLKLTLVAATPKTMIALFTRLGLDLVNDLSLLEDCFAISDHLHLRSRLRSWLRIRLRRYDDYNRNWVFILAVLFQATRTKLTIFGLRRRDRNNRRRRRLNNNRSWWLGV